jgi:hypothetical protein
MRTATNMTDVVEAVGESSVIASLVAVQAIWTKMPQTAARITSLPPTAVHQARRSVESPVMPCLQPLVGAPVPPRKCTFLVVADSGNPRWKNVLVSMLDPGSTDNEFHTI